jgi:hypothetical protein
MLPIGTFLMKNLLNKKIYISQKHKSLERFCEVIFLSVLSIFFVLILVLTALNTPNNSTGLMILTYTPQSGCQKGKIKKYINKEAGIKATSLCLGDIKELNEKNNFDKSLLINNGKTLIYSDGMDVAYLYDPISFNLISGSKKALIKLRSKKQEVKSNDKKNELIKTKYKLDYLIKDLINLDLTTLKNGIVLITGINISSDPSKFKQYLINDKKKKVFSINVLQVKGYFPSIHVLENGDVLLIGGYARSCPVSHIIIYTSVELLRIKPL